MFLTQHAVPKVIDKESPQLIRSRRLSRQVAGARVEEADELCDESIIERGYVVIVDSAFEEEPVRHPKSRAPRLLRHIGLMLLRPGAEVEKRGLP